MAGATTTKKEITACEELLDGGSGHRVRDAVNLGVAQGPAMKPSRTLV
jgi:hypothetical protein